jgi:hypothetical protein
MCQQILLTKNQQQQTDFSMLTDWLTDTTKQTPLLTALQRCPKIQHLFSACVHAHTHKHTGHYDNETHG